MKGAKKHFSRALTLLLSVLIMLQTVTVPAFAAENTTENVEVATNDASTEEESTFNLINADVQIDDEYGNEADYISEVQIPDLEQISEETLVENGVSIHSDYPGDAMVYLTQRWLNQEYGDVPGFGYVTEDGRTGWDTVYGLTRALQVELGIADLADNFGPTTERLYSQNLLRRQDGVTNRKFAILQGALWCKGYNPGYNLSETEDGAVVFNGVFDADVERAIIELKEDAGLINPDGVVTVNIMKALMSMDSFKLLSSYGGTEAVREMQQKLNRKYEACAISLSSGNGGTVRGTGSYSYGSTVTISAIPNEGYMFEGWYENGRCLDNISDEYTFTAFANRTIEAKFVPNDLTISNVEVIGDKEPEETLIFSAKAEGGCRPYVWEYTIYKGDTLYYTLSGSTFDYLEWSPTETGNYTIVVCVIDKTGFKATYSKQFSII